MRKSTMYIFILATLGLSAAVAQDKTIDDFTTGAYHSPDYRGGIHNASQNGGMMGGNRSTTVWMTTAADPYKQSSSITFQPATSSAPAAFITSSGFLAGTRFEVGYGFGTPMTEDFSPYDRIRLNFIGLSQTLNFNILLFTGSAYAQGGCGMVGSTAPFSVELPLALFRQTPGFNQASVNLIDLIFQSATTIGAANLAISSVELSNTAKPGALSCHF